MDKDPIKNVNRENEVKELLRVFQDHQLTDHESKLLKTSLAKVAASSIIVGAANGYLWWRLFKRVPLMTKIGITVAQVNIGALVGGLGGLYWISSVSKDLAHLRATPLGGKLNTWWKKYGGKNS